ncbi:uracil-DNA glycosylase-like protein [Immersiella caudata]|uniref:Uracil-DNA glycosylase-like protein n=1 Tax=Immersiella caudata TaxID=314043 RepID=A0AA40CB13_9PEZI|nr:uracil-DNA glycosylase-like protein [Immersiella caudata]
MEESPPSAPIPIPIIRTPEQDTEEVAPSPSNASEPSEANSRTPPPASFKGKLDIRNYSFRVPDAESGASGGARRSPRLSTPLRTGSASPSLTLDPPDRGRSSVSPPKRKALTNDDDPSSSTSTPSTLRSPKRTKSNSSSYAPPSTYAHLNHLPDAIGPNLLILFVGLNPGIQTARTGHAYAHPTNHFWRLLHSSGITPRLCSPTEDGQMPALYQLGLTNIVSRPSRNGAELSKAEMDDGVAILEAKARKYRPEVMCIVGKSIWESLWRVRHGRGIKKEEFRYGWQQESENIGVVGEKGQKEEEKVEGVEYGEGRWKGARVFVASSTSGLAATLSTVEKERIWRELGEWVENRREERKVKEEES